MKRKGGNKKLWTTYYRMKGEEKVSFHFPSKAEEDKYRHICSEVKDWGGMPWDVSWASTTNSYLEKERELYPNSKPTSSHLFN